MKHLAQLYRDTYAPLLAFFRRRGAGATEAEDMVQDTFMRLARAPERVQDAVSPRAYLYGVARNVRSDARRRAGPVAVELDPNVAVDDGVDPRHDDLRAAIGRLDPLHREPLLLKLQQGLSYAEIAGVLELPIGTVRSRLHHAMRKLRANLEC